MHRPAGTGPAIRAVLPPNRTPTPAIDYASQRLRSLSAHAQG